MNHYLFKPLFSFLFISFISISYGQTLKVDEVEFESSKTARKQGMYINTTLSPEGYVRTFVSYDVSKNVLGFDVYSIDASGKLMENVSEVASPEMEKKYNIEIPEPGYIENPGQGVNVLRLVTSTGILGKLKIQEGYFKPKYATSTEYGPYLTTYTSVFRGFKFVDEDETESDMRLNIYAAHCNKGDDLEKEYTILEGLVDNTIGYFNENAAFGFIGRDARIPDKDAENGANVVISGQFDGNTKSFKNIHENILTFNQALVTSGYDGKGNRSVLVSTLNAPTSSKMLNRWQAKGTPYMAYLTMDTEGSVIDNITFESNSVRGNFGIWGFENSHYILGSINSKHTGYYRFDVGSPTDFQIIKIVDGEIVAKELSSMDAIESMVVTPGGKKAKLKYGDIAFKDCIEAPNGDLMAIAYSQNSYLIFQFDSNAKLKAVYDIERIPANGYGVESMVTGDEMYIMFREQSGAISQGLKKSISRGAGYMKNTNFSRVDELMTYARIVKVNPSTKTCSEQLDFLDDVVLGEDIMFKGSSGELILPVRDKKRNYKMAIIK